MEVQGFGKPSLRYAVTLSSILSSSVGQNEAGVICEGEEVKRAHVLTGGDLTTEGLLQSLMEKPCHVVFEVTFALILGGPGLAWNF